MKTYVLGFCFNAALNKVVLIRKNRPQWQAGKLNGVGGHVEPWELPLGAMVREFREESGWSGHVMAMADACRRWDRRGGRFNRSVSSYRRTIGRYLKTLAAWAN